MPKFAFQWFLPFSYYITSWTHRNTIVLTAKQVCEIKRRSSESFNSVFLQVTLVPPYDKKTLIFWLKQSSLMPSIGWPSMCDYFNWLEDCSKFSTKYAWLFQSIERLQQIFCQCFTNKCCQKYEFYYRKRCQKSSAICIMAIMSSSLWQMGDTLIYPVFWFSSRSNCWPA